MRDAKLKNTNDSLGHLNEADEAARFADVFRAQALPLVKPEDPDDAKEWDQIARDFNRYVRPLLKKK